jgi:DNA-directed RNA polymerase subunit M/transcription elongation factor TFIIS
MTYSEEEISKAIDIVIETTKTNVNQSIITYLMGLNLSENQVEKILTAHPRLSKCFVNNQNLSPGSLKILRKSKEIQTMVSLLLNKSIDLEWRKSTIRRNKYFIDAICVASSHSKNDLYGRNQYANIHNLNKNLEPELLQIIHSHLNKYKELLGSHSFQLSNYVFPEKEDYQYSKFMGYVDKQERFKERGHYTFFKCTDCGMIAVGNNGEQHNPNIFHTVACFGQKCLLTCNEKIVKDIIE